MDRLPHEVCVHRLSAVYISVDHSDMQPIMVDEYLFDNYSAIQVTSVPRATLLEFLKFRAGLNCSLSSYFPVADADLDASESFRSSELLVDMSSLGRGFFRSCVIGRCVADNLRH